MDMINSVTSLSLRPLTTYSNNAVAETTITSFEDMLKEQKLAAQTETTIQEDGLEKNLVNRTAGTQNSESTTQSTSSSSDKTDKSSNASDGTKEAASSNEVIFRDPATGAYVRYVDVADSDVDKDGSVESTSKSDGANTTSASSMKKTKYDAYFKKAALKYDVSESLLKAIAKAESNFNANDVSSAGAIGVMQLMPATAEGLGVKNPYDPEQNIMGGAKCISQKLKEFNGNVRLALAAYNAGSGAVKRYGGVPSYCKTYVNRVLSYKEAYETASAVG